jgi:two-component system cell cycle sensor histidine kinase/response regulator CckA
MVIFESSTKRAKLLIWDIIASGLPANVDLDVIRKFVLLNLIIILGSFFLLVMSIVSFFQGDSLLGLMDFSIFLFLVLLFFILRRKKNHESIAQFGALIIGIYYLFLIAYGGINNATYLWAFTYPIIVLYLLGKRLGTYYSFSMLCLSVVVFELITKIINVELYNINLLIRFISVFLTIYIFAMVAEIIHEIVQERLKKSKNELHTTFDKIQKSSTVLADTNRLLLTEIAERKRIQKKLENSESFLDNIIESIQDGISVLNTDLTIRHTNSVMKKWYQQNLPLVGKKCYQCYHNRIEPCEICPTIRCLKSGNAEHEMVPGLPGTSVEWIELFSFPIMDKETGKRTGAVEFVRDITKSKQMELQLSRAQKMEAVGTLAGGVAHDLNNILSGIVSYPELILMDLPENSPLKSPIQTIHKSGRKAAAIVQDLLTLARRGVPVTDIVNLNDTINSFIESPECKDILKYHPKVRIELDLQSDLRNVVGSPIHISKTVMNLISNAAEAMNDGGMIHINTANQYVENQIDGYEKIPEGEYVVLQVSDSGTGISQEDVQKIFEPFYTKKAMGRSGTGLGMSVVWGTVKDLNGFIDLKSIPGTGTEFSLFFPGAKNGSLHKAKRIPIERYSGNDKILVVDDMEEQREIASAMLKKLGYTVATVPSGEEALRYLSKNMVKLIILDMIMDPGMDGLQTFEEINRRYPDQKVIIASGYSESERVKTAQLLGAGDYIKKPYTLESIGIAVRKELDK